MNKLTDNQRTRIAQAIVETKRLIAKEMSYSEEFRNQNWLIEYEAHLTKLQEAIKTNSM